MLIEIVSTLDSSREIWYAASLGQYSISSKAEMPVWKLFLWRLFSVKKTTPKIRAWLYSLRISFSQIYMLKLVVFEFQKWKMVLLHLSPDPLRSNRRRGRDARYEALFL